MTGTLTEAANKPSPLAGLVIPPAAWPVRARAVIEPPKASIARVPDNRKPNLLPSTCKHAAWAALRRYRWNSLQRCIGTRPHRVHVFG